MFDVDEQDKVEAPEPAAAGAAAPPGDGREGAPGAGPAPRRGPGGLLPVPDGLGAPAASVSTATAAAVLGDDAADGAPGPDDCLDRGLPVHGGRPLPQRHLRPRLPSITGGTPVLSCTGTDLI